jgi:hypothetical protein
MKQDSAYPHELLLNIMNLRQKKDRDAFMDKMYQALTGEFSGVLDGDNMTKEHRLALSLMIEHFQKKEEYEKCAALQKLIFKETSRKHC